MLHNHMGGRVPYADLTGRAIGFVLPRLVSERAPEVKDICFVEKWKTRHRASGAEEEEKYALPLN